MAEIIVDREKLEYGLERGIYHSDTIYGGVETPYILRFAPCGLVSSGIYEYCKTTGIPSSQHVSNPGLEFDVTMRHVIPTIDVDGDPLVIDASYSQFLRYAGMFPDYEKLTGQTIYPKEKLVTFRFSAADVFINWLTEKAVAFQSINEHPRDEFDTSPGKGFLENSYAHAIRRVYGRIYDTSKFRPWNSRQRVSRDGQQIAKYIPSDSIEVT